MNDAVRSFLRIFARLLVEEDYVGAARCLAPWLLTDGGARGLEKKILAKKQATVDAMAGFGEIGPPDGFNLGSNPLSIEKLRRRRGDMPAQVNAESFVAWCCVAVTADDEEWSLYDLWCAIVREEGRLCVGYHRVEDPD